MRVQVDLGIGQRTRQFFNAIGCTPLRNIVREKFRVIVRQASDSSLVFWRFSCIYASHGAILLPYIVFENKLE